MENQPTESSVSEQGDDLAKGGVSSGEKLTSRRIETQRKIINAAIFWGLDDFDRTRPQLDP